MNFITVNPIPATNTALELGKVIVPSFLSLGASLLVLFLTLRHSNKQLKINKELDIKKEFYGNIYCQIADISEYAIKQVAHCNDLDKVRILDEKFKKLRTDYYKMHLYMSKELKEEMTNIIGDIRYFINTNYCSINKPDFLNNKRDNDMSRIQKIFSSYLNELAENNISKIMTKELNKYN